MKRRYLVTGEATISVQVVIEADSATEARTIAEGCPMKSICYHCASASEGEWSIGEELDGEPSILVVELQGKRGGR